jgi:hypothetical protein
LNALYLVIAVIGGAAVGILVWARLADLLNEGKMSRTSRFGWFTILVTILIPVEGAMIGWVQSRESPLVKPAVVVDSTSNAVIRGFFIAATDEDVYIAEVQAGTDPHVGVPGTGTVLDIPRKQVLRLSVGSNQQMAKARARWPEMIRQIDATLPLGTRYRASP